MPELTDAQLDAACKVFEGTKSTPLRFVLAAAAPFLQMPWSDPTEDEIHEACAGSTCTWNEIAAVLVSFVRNRNAKMTHKPVDPRTEKIIGILDEINRHEAAPSNAAPRILAALDEVK